MLRPLMVPISMAFLQKGWAHNSSRSKCDLHWMTWVGRHSFSLLHFGRACTMYARCMHNNAQCMHNACTRNAGCTMYAQCMHSACTMYAQCMHNVCTMYAQCMHNVCTMYAQCMHVIRADQNRIYTPYMTICMVIFLLTIPYIRKYVWFWPTLHMTWLHRSSYLTSHNLCHPSHIYALQIITVCFGVHFSTLTCHATHHTHAQHIHMHIHMHVHIHTHIHARAHTHTYTCTLTCHATHHTHSMHHTFTHWHTHTHTHTHTPQLNAVCVGIHWRCLTCAGLLLRKTVGPISSEFLLSCFASDGTHKLQKLLWISVKLFCVRWYAQTAEASVFSCALSPDFSSHHL
jgi:hypothetical protein